MRVSHCRRGRERVTWMSSSSDPSASPLSWLPDGELGHDPVECHLGCAASADRDVPTRTRHHNDGNRGRLDPRRRETPRIHWARAQPMRRRGLFSGAQAHTRPRSSADFRRARTHPETVSRLTMRVSGMARPGLEPGTPRFSDRCSEHSNTAGIACKQASSRTRVCDAMCPVNSARM